MSYRLTHHDLVDEISGEVHVRVTALGVYGGRVTSYGGVQDFVDCDADQWGIMQTGACQTYVRKGGDVALQATLAGRLFFWGGDCLHAGNDSVARLRNVQKHSNCTVQFFDGGLTGDGAGVDFIVEGPGRVVDGGGVIDGIEFLVTKIDCGRACSVVVPPLGSSLRFVAEADPGNAISKIEGGCGKHSYSGADESTVLIYEEKGGRSTCRVTFASLETLTVSVSEGGSVSEIEAPWLINNCTSTSGSCTGKYVHGRTVWLRAEPQRIPQIAHPGYEDLYRFVGWGGDCRNVWTPLHAVADMNGPSQCTATFEPLPRAFEVRVFGNGSVSDNETPRQINGCTPTGGGACRGEYLFRTPITLTATPNPGSAFLGWGGACGHAGASPTVTVPVSFLNYCEATFMGGALTVTVIGDGGSVRDHSSTPPQIDNCRSAGGSNCTGAFVGYAIVRLGAAADPGYVFGGWGGDCVGGHTPMATVAMAERPTNCTVTFVPDGLPILSHDVATSPHVFASQAEGYAPVSPLRVTVSNHGTGDTDVLSVRLIGTGFTITNDNVDGNTIAAIAGGVPGAATFDIGPDHGLAVGTYTATVEIEDAVNGHMISFDVRFEVMPAGAVFGISHNVPGDFHDFGMATVGYGSSIPLNVMVTNTGNQPTGLLQITMASPDATSSFQRVSGTIYGIAVGGSTTLSVARPILGLAPGIYTETYTISRASLNTAPIPAISFDVRFEVREPGVVGTPVITHDVATSPHVFAAQTEGYAPVSPLRVTVSNSGDADSSAMSVRLIGADFSITNDNVDGNTIAAAVGGVPGTATFDIGPNHGLAVGRYTATVEIVDVANRIMRSFDVSFDVVLVSAIFGISHNVPPGGHDFGSETWGYGAPTPLTVVVTNTGNQDTGVLSIMQGGANPMAFAPSDIVINNIAVGGSASFTVTPVLGLAPGTHTAIFEIDNVNVPAVNFDVRFEVTPRGSGVPIISTRALSNGRVGVAYNAALTAWNVPTNWTVVNGALPPGLALDPNTGVISGRPTTVGTFTFEVTAENTVGVSAAAAISITISPAAAGLEAIPTLGHGALLLLIALLGMGIAFHPGIRHRAGNSRQ